MRTVELAVVIPCRGHARELETCLESVTRQEPGAAELVVVDAAADPDVEAVVRRFVTVRLVRSDQGLTAGAARNLGVAHTSANGIAFLDADCCTEPGWLAAARAALDSGAAAVGGPVGDTPGTGWIAAADNFLQFYDLVPERPGGPADYFPGCNLAMRRETFEALGGFPAVPIGEDVLFTVAAGHREGGLRFEPQMRVRHQGRGTLSALLQHHRVFGRARGELGLRMRAFDAWHAHHYWWVAPLIAKRIAWMTWRCAQLGPRALRRLLSLSPLVLLGIVSWALGVVEGSRARRVTGKDGSVRGSKSVVQGGRAISREHI